MELARIAMEAGKSKIYRPGRVWRSREGLKLQFESEGSLLAEIPLLQAFSIKEVLALFY